MLMYVPTRENDKKGLFYWRNSYPLVLRNSYTEYWHYYKSNQNHSALLEFISSAEISIIMFFLIVYPRILGILR